MMRLFISAALILCAAIAPVSAYSQPASPFSRGVNLTTWFQSGIDNLHFGKYDRSDLENIKSLGADVIRLPVDLKAMLRPDYSPDPRFLFFMDKVAVWADSVGIGLILDNHTFDPAVATTPDVETWLVPAWQALANHYKGRFPNLYFEIQNEPHGITDAVWNAIQLRTVAAIRGIDADRWLVIGGAGWNGLHNLAPMPDYPYQKLVYTFHYYEPFLFTHQGATWTDPSLLNLKNVPFPWNSGAIPSAPPDLAGTWVVGALQQYASTATASRIRNDLETAAAFARTRNVPVFCGEFGVYDINSPAADRKHWYKVVRTALETRGISWTSWDYHNGFGIFKKPYPAGFFTDLDVALVDSMGFTAPPQQPAVTGPLRSSITMYSDYVHKNMTASTWVANGFGSMLFPKNTTERNYVLAMAKVPQYSSINVNFTLPLDLSAFRSGASTLVFELRGTSGITKIDVRFLDTDTGVADHPWRARVELNAPEMVYNGTWRTLEIPITRFQDVGAWENNTWYNSEGKFDWSAIDRLEFVAEHHGMLQDSLFIDNIVLRYAPSTSSEISQKPQELRLSAFPNPFNPSTNVQVAVQPGAFVRVRLHDMNGRLLRTLYSGRAGAAQVQLSLDASDLASGVYVLVAESGAERALQKVTLLK
jgi:endoglucanase